MGLERIAGRGTARELFCKGLLPATNKRGETPCGVSPLLNYFLEACQLLFQMTSQTERTLSVRYPEECLTRIFGVMNIMAGYTFHLTAVIQQ